MYGNHHIPLWLLFRLLTRHISDILNALWLYLHVSNLPLHALGSCVVSCSINGFERSSSLCDCYGLYTRSERIWRVIYFTNKTIVEWVCHGCQAAEFTTEVSVGKKGAIGLWKWRLNSSIEVSGRQRICNLSRLHDVYFFGLASIMLFWYV